MTKTTFQQKIYLLGFGFFLTLALIEIGLRVGGIFISIYQEKENAATFAGDEYRILCIGESTTAIGGKNSYPQQLEDILNAKHLGKQFNVINKGVVGTISAEILHHLEENLNKYKPAIVVAMIGINDPHDTKSNNLFIDKTKDFFESWYSFRFFKYIAQHLNVKIQEMITHQKVLPKTESVESKIQQGDPRETLRVIAHFQQTEKYLKNEYNRESSLTKEKIIAQTLPKLRRQQYVFLLRIVEYYRIREDYSAAKYYFQKASALFPDDYLGYFQLAMIYKAENEYAKAIVLLKKIIEIAPDAKAIFAKIELAHCYEALGDNKNALLVYDLISHEDGKLLYINRELGDRLLEHQHYQEAEVVFKKALLENPNDAGLLEDVAKTYRRLGQNSKAEFFQNKAENLRKEEVHLLPRTALNYKKIANMVLSHGACLISMQYPLRSIKPLKETLSSNNSIIFVENKENFENELKESSYTDYFSDFFAGDFGHCTPKGNRLIAQNLAEIIQKKVLTSQRVKNIN